MKILLLLLAGCTAEDCRVPRDLCAPTQEGQVYHGRIGLYVTYQEICTRIDHDGGPTTYEWVHQ